VRQKPLFVSCLLLISIMIGGCANMESEKIITPKVEKYPNRPITLIVPYSAGGGTDLVARALEKSLTSHLGQPVIIVNKPGGAGTIGWNELTNAAPDGYTIGISTNELLLKPLYDSTKTDYPTALDPIAQVATSTSVLAILSDQPWQNLSDLIQYAKDHPYQLKFAHGGIGSNTHITGEMFGKAANINISQVPFNGNGEIVAALLGKHVQFIMTNPMTIKEYVKIGTIRVLAVANNQRMTDPLFANVPTFKEQGLNVAFSSWYGLALPKETPNNIKLKLAEELKTILTEPETMNSLEKLGLEPKYLNSEDSANRWLTDRIKLSNIIQETGILDLIKSQRQ
jgi:tripartite-type tricarboxylate transporter receptor subunit TctC